MQTGLRQKGDFQVKIKAKLDGQCILVPSEPVVKNLAECNGTRLKVLMCILACPEFEPEDVCEKLDITKKTLFSAVDFWCKCGAIETEELTDTKKPRECGKTTKAPENSKVAEGVSVRRPVMRASELPDYTSEEVTEYIEKNEGARQVIDGCSQIIGKMFNTSETKTVVGLMDYLKLDEDYIFLLFTYCAKEGKRSMRYIEKLAVELFDRGITEYRELDAHLMAMEEAHKLDKPLRKLFGIGSRSFTKKEKDIISTWAARSVAYSLIERAFEITVENTGNASMPYCSAVLDSWYQKGITTVEDAEREMANYKHDRENARDKKGSFETDDFFEAALRRSYGDK